MSPRSSGHAAVKAVDVSQLFLANYEVSGNSPSGHDITKERETSIRFMGGGSMARRHGEKKQPEGEEGQERER